MPWRSVISAERTGTGAAVIGDVEHRLDREQELLGQPNHVARAAAGKFRVSRGESFAASGRCRQAASTPVEPNPPPARGGGKSCSRSALAENAGTIANCGRAIRVKTSWAMRSPGWTVDLCAALRRVAVPGRDQARPLVIGIDDPDRVAEHQPFAVAEPGARHTSAHHSGSPMRKAMPAEISTAGACGARTSGPSTQACRSSPAARLDPQ